VTLTLPSTTRPRRAGSDERDLANAGTAPGGCGTGETARAVAGGGVKWRAAYANTTDGGVGDLGRRAPTEARATTAYETLIYEESFHPPPPLNKQRRRFPLERGPDRTADREPVAGEGVVEHAVRLAECSEDRPGNTARPRHTCRRTEFRSSEVLSTSS